MTEQKVASDDHVQNIFYFEQSPLVNKLDRDSIPIAVVIGWAASVDKHVIKYADIYKGYGYHTIRLSVTLASAMYNIDEHDKFAVDLLNLIKDDCKLNKNPIVIHLFSNTGMLIYRKIMEKCMTDEYSFGKANLKLLIYDSSPGHASNRLDFIRNTYELIAKRTNSRLYASLITIAGLVAFTFKHFGRDYITESIDIVAADANNVPTLLFYSKVDRMVSYNEVRAFVERRKSVLPDLKIESVEFDDSDHVSHYIKYKDIYLAKLKDHLMASGLAVYGIQGTETK